MFNYNLLYLVCCVTFGFISASKSLPKDFPVCKRNDPNLNDCLKQATNTIRPLLVKGVKELGIESIDPLHIDKLTMKQGSPALNFTALLRNTQIYNLKSYDFTKFTFDPNTLKFQGVCTVKKLKIEADFDVAGKVLILPVNGVGKIFIDIGELETDIREECVIKNKNGKDYILPIKITTSLKLKNPKIKITGLFKDEAINKNLNQLISENIDTFVEEFKPFLEDVVSKVTTEKLFSKIKGKIPYDNLFPIA